MIRFMTFSQVKSHFKLGQAQACTVVKNARIKKIFMRPNGTTGWKYDLEEVSGIVKRVKRAVAGYRA